MLDDRVKQHCVDCGKAILVEKKLEFLSNVCGDCVTKYRVRFGVRRPTKKPKKG